jgi:hypothetical protein
MVSERKCMWSCYDVRGLRRRQRLLPFPRYSCVAPSLRMLGTPRAQREPCLRCSASAQMQRCCLVELPASSPSARHRPRRISTRRRGPGRPGMSIFFRLRPGDGASHAAGEASVQAAGEAAAGSAPGLQLVQGERWFWVWLVATRTPPLVLKLFLSPARPPRSHSRDRLTLVTWPSHRCTATNKLRHQRFRVWDERQKLALETTDNLLTFAVYV